MKKIIGLMMIVICGLVLIACNETNTDNDTPIYTNEEKQELLVLAFYDFVNTQEGKTTIKNNDGITAVLPTDPSWDEIKSKHPVTVLDNKEVTIKFGGSTSVEKIAKALSVQFVGLAGNFKAEHNHTGSGDAVKLTQGESKDAINNLHIGFASRAWSESENGIIAANTTNRIAWDAVVAIVNENNILTNITAAQLKSIYEAQEVNQINNWNQLNDQMASHVIKAYTRDSSSGTREAFFELIGFKNGSKDNSLLVNGYTQVESNGALLNAIKGDSNGIGYVSLASLLSVTGIKGLSFEGVIPSEDTVLNNTYALKRPFNMVIRNYNK